MVDRKTNDGAYLHLVRLAERELALEASRNARVIAERLIEREQRERANRSSDHRRPESEPWLRNFQLAAIGT